MLNAFNVTLFSFLGINSHPGNKTFRKWVHERKEAYNLAKNKQEKAKVSIEVIDLVKSQRPPGRFLARDESMPSGPGVSALSASYWIEIDLNKAISKTSQALREGAPVIRAQHALEEKYIQVGGKPQQQRPSSLRKRSLPSHPSRKHNLPHGEESESNTLKQQRVDRPDLTDISSETINSRQQLSDQLVSSTQNSTMPPPLPVKSSSIAQRLFGSQNAASVMAVTAQKNEKGRVVQPSLIDPDTTPPLIPISSVDVNHLNFKLENSILELPFSDLESYSPNLFNHNNNNHNNHNNVSNKELQRAHSLATSDFIGGEELLNNEDDAFQDPFKDDMFDISVTAEGNPVTSAVHRGNSFGLNGYFDGLNNGSNNRSATICNVKDVLQGKNNDCNNASSTVQKQQRHPAVVKSLSSSLSNLSHLSSMSLSKASPLSKRLFGNVSNSSRTTPSA